MSGQPAVRPGARWRLVAVIILGLLSLGLILASMNGVSDPGCVFEDGGCAEEEIAAFEADMADEDRRSVGYLALAAILASAAGVLIWAPWDKLTVAAEKRVPG